MRITDIIAKKRDGKELSKKELDFLIEGIVKGTIADYQIAAFLMASYIKGLSRQETVDLTAAMADSGEQRKLETGNKVKVDKHSTGGVGDKTTLVVAPLVAAGGVCVPKLAGSGLGHTGGTIDKLESIPGFRTALSHEDFERQVNKIGVAIGQSGSDLAPADKKLYALRDVTATVNSMPLIASSIMSKKLAVDSDALLLDVKAGAGAFMRTSAEAAELASLMVSIGTAQGRKTVALLTAMDEPLGLNVGNALEVKEAIGCLRGNGPPDLERICLLLAGWMFHLSGTAGDEYEGERLAAELLKEGKGLEKLTELISEQGGEPEVISDPSLLPQAKYRKEVKALRSGYITGMDALSVGKAAVHLGAGRARKEDSIDHAAGIVLTKKVGDSVDKGEILAIMHTNTADMLDDAESILSKAIVFGDDSPERSPHILGIIK